MDIIFLYKLNFLVYVLDKLSILTEMLSNSTISAKYLILTNFLLNLNKVFIVDQTRAILIETDIENGNSKT